MPLTDFVQHKDQLLALVFTSADLFFYESASTTLGVSSVQHENDDVTVVNDFVQCAKIVFANLFLCLAVHV